MIPIKRYRKVRQTICFRIYFSLVLILMVPSAQAAPITFNTALPVAKGEFLIRQQFISVQSGDDPGPTDRDRTAVTSTTALVYGVNHKLALFGILPYQDIELSLNPGTGKLSRTNSGLGDVKLFGRYIFKQNNQQGRTLRWAGFAGFKAPTGDEDARDSLGTLPPPVQTGTGSWDAFGGLVFTRQTLDWQLDAQLGYQTNTEANQYEAGDIFRFDASFQKRVWPRALSVGVPGFLYGVLEMNLIHQGKNKFNGVYDPHSNGTRLLLAPGVQYVTRRWIAEASLQLPIIQDLNGSALELGHILRAGMRFNF